MLSRVANTLYWMVRYVERADNMARLIDVNEQMLLDFERLDSERLKDFWLPIVYSSGDEAMYHELYTSGGSAAVIRFLTNDRRNPNSILSCIAQARENARTVRDQLSDELWEELNSLYLFVISSEGERLLRDDPSRFYEAIRRFVFTFQGIASSTLNRNESWEFMDLGRHLERADKTTRFLDISNFLPEDASLPIHWNAILRSCGAKGAYRDSHAGEVELHKLLDLLVFSETFPRSIRHCVARVDQCLRKISGATTAQGAKADRLSGKLLSELNYGSVEEFLEPGLHQSLDHLQEKLNAIGEAVFESYVLMPHVIDKPTLVTRQSMSAVRAWKYQQDQQQQQQQQ